jgi:acyl-coenzyme A thioesterase PaaI-like protein
VTVDSAALAEALRAAVPFNTTLGLQYVEISTDRALLLLPDRPEVHNHIGGPHAAAQFGLAEAASGAIVIANFGDQMTRALPLAATAEIAYQRVAMGDLTAEATLGRPTADVIAELDAGETPRFPVHVAIRTADGTQTAEITLHWALRPIRGS